MIKQFQPILDVTNDGIDFKWFSDDELNALPVDKNKLVLVDNTPHYIWTLHHSDDGSADYVSAGYSRMNSLDTYVLTKINPILTNWWDDTEYYEVNSGVYRILKSIK